MGRKKGPKKMLACGGCQLVDAESKFAGRACPRCKSTELYEVDVQAATPEQSLNRSRPTEEPWNTRYLEYARAHGTPDPAVMLQRDAARFPGAKMVGFITWIGARWSAYRELHALANDATIPEELHHEFDAWLRLWPIDSCREAIVDAVLEGAE